MELKVFLFVILLLILITACTIINIDVLMNEHIKDDKKCCSCNLKLN